MQIIRLQVSVFHYLWSYGFVSVGSNISYNPLMSSIIYITGLIFLLSLCVVLFTRARSELYKVADFCSL